MKRLAMVAAAAVMLFAATGCEPKMTITARDADNTTGYCYVMHVTGKVTPATATPKVVLQQTKGGKWVDVTGWSGFDDQDKNPASLRTANVSQSTGNYSIPILVQWYGTRHLRVRSAGSGGTSPGFYVTTTGGDSTC